MKKTMLDLDKLADEELLKLRFRDLGLKIGGSPLEENIKQLYAELEAKGIKFRPECYLADEWLCPDREPVIGVAFYLAHPRLRKLEQKMMLEAEGDDKKSCMMLLRHEAGHAINYAYSLYLRKKWKKTFGPFSEEYPDRYKYRPYSKSFVRHLDDWYAQYHPDEDFAETFAVWLDPSSNWRERYKGWKALRKLEYVDELMKEVADKSPLKPAGKKHWIAGRMRTTLLRHYKKRRESHADSHADFHDAHLRRIFGEGPGPKQAKKAHKLLRENRDVILDHVALWTGEKKFIINRLIKDLIQRARELRLVVEENEKIAILKLTSYITTQTMNYLYTGRYRGKRWTN